LISSTKDCKIQPTVSQVVQWLWTWDKHQKWEGFHLNRSASETKQISWTYIWVFDCYNM